MKSGVKVGLGVSSAEYVHPDLPLVMWSSALGVECAGGCWSTTVDSKSKDQSASHWQTGVKVGGGRGRSGVSRTPVVIPDATDHTARLRYVSVDHLRSGVPRSNIVINDNNQCRVVRRGAPVAGYTRSQPAHEYIDQPAATTGEQRCTDCDGAETLDSNGRQAPRDSNKRALSTAIPRRPVTEREHTSHWRAGPESDSVTRIVPEKTALNQLDDDEGWRQDGSSDECIGLDYLSDRMAYLEMQERESNAGASPWLRYHLGQSMGYRDITKRLQKRTTQEAPVLKRSYLQANKSLPSPGYQSLALVPPSPRIQGSAHASKSRLGSGNHVINSGNYFWLRRGVSNLTSSSMSPTTRPVSRGRIPGREGTGNNSNNTQGANKKPGESQTRACKSANNRLLGTARSDYINLLPSPRRNTYLDSKYSSDTGLEADIVFLKVAEAEKSSPRSTPRALEHDVTGSPSMVNNNRNIVSVQHDSATINYKLGSTQASNGGIHDNSGSPDMDEDGVNVTLGDQNLVGGAPPPPPSPTQHADNHTYHVVESRTEFPTGTEYDYAESVFSNDSLDTADDPTSGRLGTPTGGDPGAIRKEGNTQSNVTDSVSFNNIHNLTVSEYFSVNTDSEHPTGSERDSSSTSGMSSTLDDVLSNTDVIDRTKRAVRFSLENSVHEYAPWEPINGQIAEPETEFDTQPESEPETESKVDSEIPEINNSKCDM